MAGKGKRRREKNFRDAHGGSTRLPPPPDPSKLDALPSKLRKLISFTSLSQDSTKGPNDSKRRKIGNRDLELESRLNDEVASESTGVEDLNVTMTKIAEDQDSIVKTSANEPKKKMKKKRKRNQAEDLRFAETMEKFGTSSKRREHKKKYLEAKKNKRNKAKNEDAKDIRHDKVEFGDVVQAPLKLAVVPKAPKKKYSASQERVRLKAVEEYRHRRGWEARPGNHLPSLVTPTTEL